MKSSKPKVGDLVYCHIVGSTLGWYLDQLGIIVHTITPIIAVPPATTRSTSRIYEIYLLNKGNTERVSFEDFKKGSIEVITKAGEAKIKEISEKKAKFQKLQQLKMNTEIS
jgi:hypothetical protein